MQLLETGLGNVTWWGYSSSFDVLEGIEKSGKYLVLRPYLVFVHSDPNGLIMFSENITVYQPTSICSDFLRFLNFFYKN